MDDDSFQFTALDGLDIASPERAVDVRGHRLDAVIDHHHRIATHLRAFFAQLLFDLGHRWRRLDAAVEQYLAQAYMAAGGFCAQHLNLLG
ncbi:hypothetical protein D3C85_983270 [compost metagenome]